MRDDPKKKSLVTLCLLETMHYTVHVNTWRKMSQIYMYFVYRKTIITLLGRYHRQVSHSIPSNLSCVLITHWKGRPWSWFHWPSHFCRSSGRTSGTKTAFSSVHPLGGGYSCARAYPVAPQSDQDGPHCCGSWRENQSLRCSVEPEEFAGWASSDFLCAADGRRRLAVRKRKSPQGPPGEEKPGRKATLVALRCGCSQCQSEPQTGH